MELDALNTVAVANEGVEMEIRHPRTKAGMGAFIQLYGMDSKVYREVTKELAKQMNEDTTMEWLETERIIRCTKNWRGFTLKGEEVRFSEAALRDLFAKAPEIRDQAVAFAKDRANFLSEGLPS